MKIKCACGGWGLKESAEQGKTLTTIEFGILGKWACYVPFSFLSLFYKFEFFPNKRFENNYLSSLKSVFENEIF